MRKCSWLLTAALMVCALSPTGFAASQADFTPGTYTDATGTTPYQLHVPANYDPNKAYPFVLFLHGAGEQGTDNLRQINGNIDNLLNHVKMAQYESFLLAPQSNDWWSSSLTRVHNLMEQLKTQYNIKPDQIFCTGLSMGGGGTWGMAERFIDDFDVFVPICGTGPNMTAAANIAANLKPTWVFHAADDPTVSVTVSRRMVQAIKDDGGLPLYTEYPTGGHGIWGTVYNTTALYEWMYSYPTMEVYGPQLTFQEQDLGDGLHGFTFSIANNDELLQSYAATLSFYTDPGTTLINVQINDMDVNDEPTANLATMFGFDPDRDTYSLLPFENANAIPGNSLLWGDTFNGYREGAGYWEMSIGTGYGSQHGDGTPVAYVVADGNVNWIGTIARDNKLYDTQGVTDLPEGTILGDYTGNGVVDQADYTLWADSFGQMCSAVFAPGSYAEPDHPVDTREYTTWADHFGDTASQTLGMTQSIVPAGAAEPVLVTGGAAEGDFNGDGKVDLADYTAWADGIAAEAPALDAVQSQSPAVAEEEEPADDEPLTPAQARRAKIQARRAALREARKARLEARRQARLERLSK